MAKITAYIPEPTQDYDVNNQRQILEAINTLKDQLNFGFQKDLKDELETFSWFLIGTGRKVKTSISNGAIVTDQSLTASLTSVTVVV
jgi:hypothetical protein